MHEKRSQEAGAPPHVTVHCQTANALVHKKGEDLGSRSRVKSYEVFAIATVVSLGEERRAGHHLKVWDIPFLAVLRANWFI